MAYRKPQGEIPYILRVLIIPKTMQTIQTLCKTHVWVQSQERIMDPNQIRFEKYEDNKVGTFMETTNMGFFAQSQINL